MKSFEKKLEFVSKRIVVETREGVTRTWTYSEYFEDIKKAARSFIKVNRFIQFSFDCAYSSFSKIVF